MIFRNNRAEMTERMYFVLFEILLVVLVAGIIFAKIEDVRTNQLFQKKFLARDLALVKNVEYSAPGVLVYAYGKTNPVFSLFEVALQEGTVTVGQTPYPFAADANAKFSSVPVAGTKGIALVRSEGEQWVGLEQQVNPLRLNCPALPSVARVTLDAGHGWSRILADKGEPAGDKGIETSAGHESEITRRLGAGVYGHEPAFYAVTRDLKEDSPMLLEERQRKIEGTLLSLHASTVQTVKAYVNAHGKNRDESIALACHVLNAITDAFPAAFSGASVIPVDIPRLAPDDAKRVLVADKPGVLLEIGNIADASSPLYKNPNRLADAIHGVAKAKKVIS
jgi:hypothetical protein